MATVRALCAKIRRHANKADDVISEYDAVLPRDAWDSLHLEPKVWNSHHAIRFFAFPGGSAPPVASPAPAFPPGCCNFCSVALGRAFVPCKCLGGWGGPSENPHFFCQYHVKHWATDTSPYRGPPPRTVATSVSSTPRPANECSVLEA